MRLQRVRRYWSILIQRHVYSFNFFFIFLMMVSFELGKEVKKDGFLSCLECGTKKKFLVPMRNQTPDLRIPCSNTLPQSHRC